MTQPLIPLVAQHSDFVIINKPADLDCHQVQAKSQSAEFSKHASSGLFYQMSQQLNQPLWPVHRLDKMTSGLLIMAKNKAAAQIFSDMFEKHQIEKTYLAISDKKPKKKQGKIVGDMKKSRSGNWKLCHSHNDPAVTRFVSYPIESIGRLFVVTPQTGKTHQIRVALKSIGAAILGDPRYASKENQRTIDRGYLHAWRLTFDWQGQRLSYICPPDDGKYFTHPNTKQRLTQMENELATNANPFNQ